MKLESRKGTPAGALVTPLFWSGGYVPATPGRRSRPGVFLRESIRGGGGLKATTRPGSGSTRKPHQCQRRKVELTKAAIVALRRHRTRQLEERFAAVGGWEELDLVFANEVGRPTTTDRLRWNFQRTLVRANLPRIRFHDLRHTAATLLLGRAVHPKIEPHGSESVPTHYFRRQRARPFHIDYCYASRALLAHTAVEIGSPDEWLELSDHMPVIVDIRN